MSKSDIYLCSLLLNELFGDIVEAVGHFLLTVGSKSLREILSAKLNYSGAEIKQALSVLIHHNLVSFTVKENGVVEYIASCYHILLLLRFPRYIYAAKTLYGESGELIVKEILGNGQIQMSQVIEKVVERLAEANGKEASQEAPQNTRNIFKQLADTHFVIRCPSLVVSEGETNKKAPSFVLKPEDSHKVPDIHLYLISAKLDEKTDPPVAKKMRLSPEGNQQPDKDIYWTVNFERFHQLFRDQAVVGLITRRVDATAGLIAQTLLRLSEKNTPAKAVTTNPIARHELLETLKKESDVSQQVLDPYLSLLSEDDSRCLYKAEDRLGGMYTVNIRNAFKLLAEGTVTAIVEDRFGSKCCRLFRILLKNKYLEQKQLEDCSMIPAKDAKAFTYQLLRENFISFKEVPKTPDRAPSRTFFLFCVDLEQLSRMLLRWSFKAVSNAISRRNHETNENKRLLEKQQRVEAIVDYLQKGTADESQIQEVAEMITPPEKEKLSMNKMLTEKLDMCEIQLDENIFILQKWLDMKD